MIYNEKRIKKAFTSLAELLKEKKEEELIKIQQGIYEKLLCYRNGEKTKEETYNNVTDLIKDATCAKKNNATSHAEEKKIKSTVKLYMNLTLPRYFLKYRLYGINENELNQLDSDLRKRILNEDLLNITEITNVIYDRAQDSTLPELRHLGQQPCKEVARYYIQFFRKWPLSMNLITCAVYLSYIPLWITYLISNYMVLKNDNCGIMDFLRFLKDNLGSFEVYILFITAAFFYLIAYNFFESTLAEHRGIIAEFARDQTGAFFVFPTLFYTISFIRGGLLLNCLGLHIRVDFICELIITIGRFIVFISYLRFLWIYLISPWLEYNRHYHFRKPKTGK